MKHPFLTGKKIYLRALEGKDLSGDYFQWFNDPQTCRYNSHAIFPSTKKKMRDYFNEVQGSRTAIVFAIIDKRSGKHVGNISLQNIDWVSGSAEIAFIISAKYSGKGFGFEAGHLVIDYAFKRLNLIRVYCGTSSENIPMQKLAGKLGMQKEGRRRQAMFKNNKYNDIIEYGLLKNEFIPK